MNPKVTTQIKVPLLEAECWLLSPDVMCVSRWFSEVVVCLQVILFVCVTAALDSSDVVVVGCWLRSLDTLLFGFRSGFLA